MKTPKKTIPWEFVEKHLPADMGPAELARRLGIAKSVVGNWGGNSRRGVPLSYARDLGRILGVGVDEILDSAGSDELSNSGQNTRLSDEARALIMCVARLDKGGNLARKTFAATQGLLLLSEVAAKMQDSSEESEPNIQDVVRLLQSSLGQQEGNPDESTTHKAA
jgi:hypothetical protein